jgi:hypothetical protein
MIDTVGKDGLAMAFATQREMHLSADVLDALKRVYTQCVPRRPMVNIVLDSTEPPDPPRQPIPVFVERVDLAAHPQMSETEQLQIRQQMKDRFGPVAPHVDLTPEEDVEEEPEPPAEEQKAEKPKSEPPKTKRTPPKPPPPANDDDTDAKPW